MIYFTATRLQGLGKKGILTPDENGYYTTVLGGLNCFNASGEKYVLEGAKQLFESSSALMRRIRNGSVYAEYGHPAFEPGMSKRQYLSRLSYPDERRVCAHISDVWLDFDAAKNDPNVDDNVVFIMGKVRPYGTLEKVCRDALENGKQNMAFSVRGFTEDFIERGVRCRRLVEIVTWDLVSEPGIAHATKYNSPTLENSISIPVTDHLLDGAMGGLEGVAQESGREVLTSIKQRMQMKPNRNKNLYKW